MLKKTKELKSKFKGKYKLLEQAFETKGKKKRINELKRFFREQEKQYDGNLMPVSFYFLNDKNSKEFVKQQVIRIATNLDKEEEIIKELISFLVDKKIGKKEFLEILEELPPKHIELKQTIKKRLLRILDNDYRLIKIGIINKETIKNLFKVDINNINKTDLFDYLEDISDAKLSQEEKKLFNKLLVKIIEIDYDKIIELLEKTIVPDKEIYGELLNILDKEDLDYLAKIIIKMIDEDPTIIDNRILDKINKIIEEEDSYISKDTLLLINKIIGVIEPENRIIANIIKLLEHDDVRDLIAEILIDIAYNSPSKLLPFKQILEQQNYIDIEEFIEEILERIKD